MSFSCQIWTVSKIYVLNDHMYPILLMMHGASLWFNYDNYIMSDLDLFLVTSKQPAPISTKIFFIAVLGITAVYGLGRMLFPEDESNEQDKEDSKPAGIYNEGNTCFVNSLLQALSSLQSFQQNLSQAVERFRGHNDQNEELIIELFSVMKKLNSNSQSIGVTRLLQLISTVKEGLINLEQQDAHELYSAIIGSFQHTLSKQKSIDLSASLKMDSDNDEVENNLLGFTKSSITCSECRAETAIKIHPFYDLSLEIKPMRVFDIPSALLQFQREQRIQNWVCTNCSIQRHSNKLANSAKRLKGPHKEQLSIIAQQIGQFLQNLDNGEMDISEVNCTLANFVRGFSREYQQMEGDPQRDSVFVQLQGVQTTILKKTVITKFPKILVIHLKQLVINQISGYPQLLRKHIAFQDKLSIPMKQKLKEYRLTSLLTHIGNESMGHYFTFKRLNSPGDHWYVISDSDSRKCEWSYVKQSRAYMLFYEADE